MEAVQTYDIAEQQEEIFIPFPDAPEADTEERWYVLRVVQPSRSCMELLEQEPSVFYPTYFEKFGKPGHIQTVIRPKISGYAFMRGIRSDVAAFCMSVSGVSMSAVKEGRGKQIFYRPMTVGDAEMECFMEAVNKMEGEMKLFDPRDIDLTEGDQIQVVGGPFDGIEGVLIAQQGKDGGMVYIRLNDSLYGSTLQIESSQIRIMAFGKGNRHVYDKLRSVRRRIESAAPVFASGRSISPREQQAFQFFLQRYGDVRLDTTRQRIEFLLALHTIHTLLRQDDQPQGQRVLGQLQEISDSLTQSLPTLRAKDAPARRQQLADLQCGIRYVSELKSSHLGKRRLARP